MTGVKPILPRPSGKYRILATIGSKHWRSYERHYKFRLQNSTTYFLGEEVQERKKREILFLIFQASVIREKKGLKSMKFMALASGGSVGWSVIPSPKGCRFDSPSGHMPSLWVQCLVWVIMGGNQSMFLSHTDVSLSPFLCL